METCIRCGGEAKSFFRSGTVGNQVWFRCQKCETEWQDHCHTCGSLMEIHCSLDDAFATCVVCGGQ
ncbi:MAG: hypothetical protein WCX74_02020 [Candidatus Paceibacterota bacterium]